MIFLLSIAAALAVAASAGEDNPRIEAPLTNPYSIEHAPSVDFSVQDDKRDNKRDLDRPEFSFGPVAGYVKARDADRGTWFGGVQARLRFLRILAVEASITVHQNEFAGGDVEVTQYPVQVSVLLLPLPRSPVEPYAIAGAGWYYTRIDYDDSIGGGDDTDRLFGVHVGAGVLVELGPHIGLFADFRWIFIDEPGVDNSQIEDEEFDSGQVTLGASFRF